MVLSPTPQLLSPGSRSCLSDSTLSALSESEAVLLMATDSDADLFRKRSAVISAPFALTASGSAWMVDFNDAVCKRTVAGIATLDLLAPIAQLSLKALSVSLQVFCACICLRNSVVLTECCL
jgi:hypothetical protein